MAIASSARSGRQASSSVNVVKTLRYVIPNVLPSPAYGVIFGGTVSYRPATGLSLVICMTAWRARLAMAALALTTTVARAGTLPAGAAKFVQQHCAECHDADTKEGG